MPFIVIDPDFAAETTYPIDTDSQTKRARIALREAGVASAKIYLGDHEDSYASGNTLFAAANDYLTEDGVGVTLTQEAYPANDGNSEYWARAVDREGNDYRVTWLVADANAEQPEDACDWANPYSIERQ